MEILDAIARRYGVRPSVVAGVEEPFPAFSIDLHAHNWGVQREEILRAQAEARRR
jgi:hypothetical protein